MTLRIHYQAGEDSGTVTFTGTSEAIALHFQEFCKARGLDYNMVDVWTEEMPE